MELLKRVYRIFRKRICEELSFKDYERRVIMSELIRAIDEARAEELKEFIDFEP